MAERLADVIEVARGNTPADLLLEGASVVNVFTGEVRRSNVAISGGVIAGVGGYTRGRETADLSGKYLIPGLIDAHIHIESSMLTPPAFASAVVPHGVTAVVADPHEIVNVAGAEGFRYMADSSRGLPMDIFYMVPSCVPATGMETAGAAFGPGEIIRIFETYPESPGLAEMMNFPGVCTGAPDVLAKIGAARESGRLVDGHAPGLGGPDLNAYISAGIYSDHECTTAEEALEKIRLGMQVIIREGSAAKNLSALLPAVSEKSWPNVMFGSDDRHPEDLISEGGVNHILRRAVAEGLDPVTALRMATINPARHYNLRGLGGIAPGYRANLAVVDSLERFRVKMVYHSGRLVARDGRLLAEPPRAGGGNLLNTVRLPGLKGRLSVERPPTATLARVIEVLPDQILTRGLLVPAGEIDAGGELARVAVVERHGRSGSIAVGLARGFGSLRGAMASTVAHDSHNLVLIGTDDRDMELAAGAVAERGGGMAVASGGRVLACLELPVAGLMSGLDAAAVAARHRDLCGAAAKIGCTLPSPFMTMSFIALPVIPDLKITDRGLVDVNRFQLVDLWA